MDRSLLPIDRRQFLKAGVLTAAGMGLLTCVHKPSVTFEPLKPLRENPHKKSAASTDSDDSKPDLEKVLLIGIDGLRPDALEVADTPNIDRLINEGAYSGKAQAGKYTMSGPGWSNILLGVWEHKHGVKDNSFKGSKYDEYPSLFARLEEVRPELYTVSIVSWKPIHDHIITTADKRIHHAWQDKGDELVTQDAVKILRDQDPDVLFVYFADVDETGHQYGFHSTVREYVRAIERVDDEIGQIMRALHDRKQYSHEDWLVLATTDHGGRGTGHGGQSPEEKTIFYIARGSAAVRGAIAPPPTQVDIAPTVFRHMNVPIDPAWKLDGKAAGIK
ncbi:alkaline phosphatase family protein [Candidatus Woesearchaeota archaeon]|nr:alkaline phosphatase family protein [Candidatus Woesearchaeota archaeon]